MVWCGCGSVMVWWGDVSQTSCLERTGRDANGCGFPVLTTQDKSSMLISGGPEYWVLYWATQPVEYKIPHEKSGEGKRKRKGWMCE